VPLRGCSDPGPWPRRRPGLAESRTVHRGGHLNWCPQSSRIL